MGCCWCGFHSSGIDTGGCNGQWHCSMCRLLLWGWRACHRALDLGVKGPLRAVEPRILFVAFMPITAILVISQPTMGDKNCLSSNEYPTILMHFVILSNTCNCKPAIARSLLTVKDMHIQIPWRRHGACIQAQSSFVV
eukprot:scaffold309987_cov19-Tisochrysis_lutea.AAC.1